MRLLLEKYAARLSSAVLMGGGAAVTYAADAGMSDEAVLEVSVEPVNPAAPIAEFLADLLPASHPWVATSIVLGSLVILAILAHLIVRWVVLVVIDRLVHRTPTSWDEALRDAGVFRRLVPVVPVVLIHWGILLVPHLSEPVVVLVQRLAMATIVLLVARVLGALLAAVNAIYQRYPISQGHPIKGYLQVVKVVAYLFAGLLVFATLMDQSPWFFVSGMGAMTAIFMLVFRDTLLSFVAGIQLVNNGVIRVGDWIEMPQFDANGFVIDIALNVVAVQNWDKTVTVIPTHKFLEHSFKNWRGMFDSGGRRIKRSIHLDMTSIRFLTDKEIQRFSRFLLLKDYIREKVDELEAYNREHCPEDVADVVTNARRLTNVGTFRAYVTRYLRQHPQIHNEMTFLVRQLQPTGHGLPIELYVFTTDTRWAVHEGIQADVFDHLLAALPEFGLRVFQEPSGHDIALLGGTSHHGTAGNGQPRRGVLASHPAGDGYEEE